MMRVERRGGMLGFLVDGVSCSTALNENSMSEGQQRTSTLHIATVKEGIQDLDKNKVINGLEGLYSLYSPILYEGDIALSPLFDLVTTMREGREDFLSFEIKHLFSFVIRCIAQRVYDWDQSKVGVTQHTKDALQEGLGRLRALLEPTKEPCVISITNIEITKIIVSQLSMSDDGKGTDLGKLLSTTVSAINGMKQFFNDIKDNISAKDIDPITLPLKVIGLIYEKTSARVFELANDFREQQIMLQLILVDAWRSIVLERTVTSEIISLQKEEIKKVLEGLLQHFEKGFLGEEGTLQKGYKWLYEKGNEILRQIKGTDAYTKALVEHIVKEIKEIEENLDKKGEEDTIMRSLRNITFYALVDLYARTTEAFVKCEILNVFGEVAALLKSDLLNDNSLKKLIATRGSTSIETASNPELSKHIEAIALMNLIWVVWPAKIHASDPVILSLTSGNAQAFSKEWQLQCTAVEALLRFDYFYRKKTRKKPEQPTPIDDFLEEVGQEYQLIPLFVNRLGLTKEQVIALREFIAHTKDATESSIGKEALARLTGQDKKTSKETLIAEKNKIKEWLKSTLKLEDEECEALLDFLGKEDKKRGNEGEVPYSEYKKARKVLDKLINKFYLTPPERKLIDKAIFQGQGKTSEQASLVEKLAEAFKSFLGNDNYPKIACAFNNLGKIKTMIEGEEKVKEQDSII
jgi:hypothetical protein